MKKKQKSLNMCAIPTKKEIVGKYGVGICTWTTCSTYKA